MAAEIPPLDEPVPMAAPAAPAAPAPPPVPVRNANPIGPWLAMLVMAGVMLFGLSQLSSVLGLFEVSAWWTPPPESLGLNRMAEVARPDAAATAPDPARPAPETRAIAVRDSPPRPPAPDLPQFSIRDGEQYDFITDLDAETMRRLGAVQGQLDGMADQLGALNQRVQTWADRAGQQLQQTSAHQRQIQEELTATRRQMAALWLAAQELEARLKRGPPVSDGAGAPGGAPVPGWSVAAISGARAWLRTPQGGTVTVTAGERLKALGVVRAVDLRRRIVVLEDGRYVR